MKKLNKNSIVAALAVSLTLGFAGPLATFAAVGIAPDLGAASPYSIVASTWTNSLNAGLETAIIGGVCYTTPPDTAPISINGITTTPLSQAVVPCTNGAAQAAALVDLNAQAADSSCTSLGTNVVLSGTYTPGCYKSSGTMDIALSTTITLNGQGIYIFKSGGALTTGANSVVALTNGALAQNVYWVPGGLASIGANSATSPTPTFAGNIIADALGSTGITVGHFVNLRGRLLAFGHTVTTDSNTITVPTTLHVIKLVVNGNGGTAVASSFNIHVKSGGVDVSGSPAAGAAAPGTSYSLSAGNYTVSEDANTSYVQTFTGTGCDSSGNVTLATGDDKTCTVVNTDIPVPVAAAISGGSTGVSSRIVPMIGLLKIPSPLALPAGTGPVSYGYTVWNVGGAQALIDVTVTDDKCGPVTFVSGDLNGNKKLDPGEIWKYSCTTTLSQTTTNTAIATGYSDDGNHQAAIATSLATVVVGSPLTPPLINIVKVPSRLTPFPYGGGNVTYIYAVTNPGVVPMHNVTVTDDKCSPVSRTSGDTNGNNLLDPGETWAYTCTTNITASTRNVATAEGKANGFTALGYAFATVLVSAPGLPNTGFPPEANSGIPWGIVILAGSLLLVSISIAVVLKKRKI
ncbi:MAG TPA: ice-binding family protein [Candidatus Paceibacterota bacterium]|nr:ice-binding family protein [Candidatus Paceibacterota bacterium]